MFYFSEYEKQFEVKEVNEGGFASQLTLPVLCVPKLVLLF